MEKTKAELQAELLAINEQIKEKDRASHDLMNEAWYLRTKRDDIEAKIRAANLYYEGQAPFVPYLTKTKIPYAAQANVFYVSVKYTCVAAEINEFDFYKFFSARPLFSTQFIEISDLGFCLPIDYILAALLSFDDPETPHNSRFRDKKFARVLEVYNLLKAWFR
jgi:hypothetical protein